MQIQGDYHPHSGSGYEPAHTHHFTKCLREEEHAKQQAGAAGIKNKALSPGASEDKTNRESIGAGDGIRKRGDGKAGRPGLLKGFWDSLGEEKESGKNRESIYPARDGAGSDFGAHTAGISAASAVIRQLVPAALIARLGNVREKIKAEIGTALKRFGKRDDAFGALSNPGSYFEGKQKGKEKFSEKHGKGTRRADQEILTATFSDSHLMDSYSKTGRYCRLNENMTYQKNRGDKDDAGEEIF